MGREKSAEPPVPDRLETGEGRRVVRVLPKDGRHQHRMAGLRREFVWRRFPDRKGVLVFDAALAVTLHGRGVKTFHTRNTRDFRDFGLFDVVDRVE